MCKIIYGNPPDMSIINDGNVRDGCIMIQGNAPSRHVHNELRESS